MFLLLVYDIPDPQPVGAYHEDASVPFGKELVHVVLAVESLSRIMYEENFMEKLHILSPIYYKKELNDE